MFDEGDEMGVFVLGPVFFAVAAAASFAWRSCAGGKLRWWDSGCFNGGYIAVVIGGRSEGRVGW